MRGAACHGQGDLMGLMGRRGYGSGDRYETPMPSTLEMWGREWAGALGKAQKLVPGLEHVLQVRTAHRDDPSVDCGWHRCDMASDVPK